MTICANNMMPMVRPTLFADFIPRKEDCREAISATLGTSSACCRSNCLGCAYANDAAKGPSDADAPQPVQHGHEHRQHWKRE